MDVCLCCETSEKKKISKYCLKCSNEINRVFQYLKKFDKNTPRNQLWLDAINEVRKMKGVE